MFAFFDSIISIISTVINFIVNTIQYIVYICTLTVTGLTYSVATISYLPAFATAFALAIVGYSIIMFIISVIK